MSSAVVSAVAAALWRALNNGKNIVSQSWSLTQNFDGTLDTLYPTGNKPAGYQTTPTILYTDVVDGPVTGGINGKGLPINIFGYAFGTRANIGTAAGARVYLRDPAGANTWIEVGHYNWLAKAKTFNWNQLQQLCIDPGNLGGTAVAGRALDLKVNVNGVDSNILTAAFTVQPGNFFYVDHDNGNDATGAMNDPTKPFKHLQVYNSGSSTYSGLFTSLSKTGGDVILIKGTTSDNLGVESKYMRFYDYTGSAPTGSAGTGYIKMLNWPSSTGPSTWTFNGPAADNGGITGVIQNKYNLAGKYFVISGYTGVGNPTGNSDASPMNGQSGAIYWRIINCDLSWLSTVTGANNARAGGIAGEFENSVILGNHIHDISGDPNNLENHGVYLGDSAGVCTKNLELAWNVIKDITGGSGTQCNNNSASDNFTGIKIHHNWIENVQKYCININDTTLVHNCWNNILINPVLNCYRIGTYTTGASYTFVHNTCIQTQGNNGTEGSGMLASNALTSGTYLIANNILYRAGNNGSVGVTYSTFDTASGVTLRQNLYFDALGTLTTVPSSDTTGIYGDPLFTDFTNQNYTLKTGSPALNACTSAEPYAITTDFFGIARQVIDTSTPSTVKNDIGATEGVGT
jgi:hypothetical protein